MKKLQAETSGQMYQHSTGRQVVVCVDVLVTIGYIALEIEWEREVYILIFIADRSWHISYGEIQFKGL